MNAVGNVLLFVLSTCLTLKTASPLYPHDVPLTTASPCCPYDVPEIRSLPGNLFTTQGCSCYNEVLDCFNLLELPELNHTQFTLPVTSAKFTIGDITSIPSNRLPFGLNSIYFNDLPLTKILDDAFINSAQTLNSLTIIGAQFGQLPKALLELTNLTSLHIENAPIENWDFSILEHIITNLTYLHLVNVGLTIWPGAISLSHLLVDLALNHNTFKYIPKDAFSSSNTTLKKLSLGYTGLTSVPLALYDLTSLTSLDLSGITLSDVHDIEKLASWPFGRDLVNITLESSGLESILNFSSFTSLLQIHLNNNNISDAASGFLPPSVTDLYLEDNHLSSVPTAIGTLPHLLALYLSNNQITGIEPGSLPSSLTSLGLANNKITVITNTTFQNMIKLSLLSLSFNSISTIAPLAFSDLASLESLYLRDTNLTEVPLAMASLPPKIDMTWSQEAQVQCPCPPASQLVDWHALSRRPFGFSVDCDNGLSVNWYLIDSCQYTITTSKDGGATTLKCCLFVIHGSLLLLMTVLLFLE